MDEYVSARVIELMEEGHYTQASFARKCGLNYQNFNKYVNGKKEWSDKATNKISDALNVSSRWLRDGIGEKFLGAYHKDKKEGNAQLAALRDISRDVDDYTHVVNTINGEHNSGTQTIQTGDSEVEKLRQKVAALEAALAEREKTIDLLRDIIQNK